MKRSLALPMALVVAIGLATAACGGATTTPQGSPIATPPSAPTTAATEPELRMVSDVLYQEDPDGTQHKLTVYAPAAEGGPWPVAVMIHGLGAGMGRLIQIVPEPSAVAAQGIVVFVPRWRDPSWASAEAMRAEVAARDEQLACAVRFARAEAERYGGDPSNLSLYGHSAGAMAASILAFADPRVAEGCVISSGPVVPDNLVLFEGDWLLVALREWDRLLEEDPRLMEALTPWSYLDEATRMPVHILDSDDPHFIRRTAEDVDRWLALRDPTGDFRLGLGVMYAFSDGVVVMREAQRLLYDRLQILGYQVTFHDLPGSSHTYLSEAAVQVVVDAILLARRQ